eukprot:CAMPEP_0197590196 /NCGR_PEP_ID=MMETSP1326-20131121/10868_1 /TAXON_ID=1155430 /ORGANISM="Genus nov. species nov., Strain RCC2288" /LENGTH=189 /DNA_ID=CAMNT_0043155205 /DNA_START=171 /DNA_END=737 /DNA_ORIENTATION=-
MLLSAPPRGGLGGGRGALPEGDGHAARVVQVAVGDGVREVEAARPRLHLQAAPRQEHVHRCGGSSPGPPSVSVVRVGHGAVPGQREVGENVATHLPVVHVRQQLVARRALVLDGVGLVGGEAAQHLTLRLAHLRRHGGNQSWHGHPRGGDGAMLEVDPHAPRLAAVVAVEARGLPRVGAARLALAAAAA